MRKLKGYLRIFDGCLLGKNSASSASLVVQMVKNLPAMLETWVLSLGQEDPLRKE